MTTGERLRTLRKELGISADDVARALGVSRATVFRYEKGDIEKVPGSMLEPLAKVLHTTPAYLMGWEDNSLPADAYPYNPTHRIPVLGRISAGLPLYAEEHIEGWTYTELNGGAEYFALRVHGDSMDALGIKDGYLVDVRRQDMVENGEVAIVMVGDDEATMKRFYQDGDTVTLMPQSTNPAHMPQIYNLKETPIRVIGKVVKAEFQVL
ncbi:LexA family protein [Butyricicoccus sp.]|uniref:LexA family protein n=1 Tax=Butyricicoccus sp. TaxID=2049021 RepID=UPI003F16018B